MANRRKTPAAYPPPGEQRTERVIVMMTKAEVDAIDAWAVPAAMPSRSHAIRRLVEVALETGKVRPLKGEE